MPIRKPPPHVAPQHVEKRPPAEHRRPAQEPPGDDQISMLGYVLKQDSGEEKW
jgi:hypothetical protein